MKKAVEVLLEGESEVAEVKGRFFSVGPTPGENGLLEEEDSVEVELQEPRDIGPETMDAIDQGVYDQDEAENILKPYRRERVEKVAGELEEYRQQIRDLELDSFEFDSVPDMHEEIDSTLESRRENVNRNLPAFDNDMVALLVYAPDEGYTYGFEDHQGFELDGEDDAYMLGKFSARDAERIGLIDTERLELGKGVELVFYASELEAGDKEAVNALV
jgi:hypothetical protein